MYYFSDILGLQKKMLQKKRKCCNSTPFSRLLAGCPWASDLVSQHFYFLFYKIEIKGAPTSPGIFYEKSISEYKAVKVVSGT